MDNGLQALAGFAHAARCAQMSPYAAEQLKVRLLDTLGVAIAALDAAGTGALRAKLPAAHGADAVTVIGGGAAAAEAATRFNAALVRRLDFNDVHLAPTGASHPSVGIPAVLAAAELGDAGGADLLTALAVLYAAYTQLADHAAAGAGAAMAACSTAVAAGRAMGLDAARSAAAARLAASTAKGRTADDSDGVAARALHGALAAQQPPAGEPAAAGAAPDVSAVDWSRTDLEGVRRTSVRQYATDLQAQAAVDLAVSVSARPLFHVDAIRTVRISTHQAAFDRLGGGDGTDRYQVRTAAQARGSLPYAVAVALLDRALGPEQYADATLARADVQALLRKVSIVPHAAFTARYPAEMCAQIDVERNDGIVNCTSTSSFRGFTLQPLTFQQAADKFERLAFAFTGELLGQRIVACVRELERHRARELTALLAQVSPTRQ